MSIGEGDWSAEYLQYLLANGKRNVLIDDIRYERDKFVSSIASNGVSGTEHTSQPVGDFLQHSIAYFMAMLVIDRFESIKINENAGKGVMGTACPGDFMKYPILEQRSIGESSQCVMQGTLENAFYLPMSFCNITDYSNIMGILGHT